MPHDKNGQTIHVGDRVTVHGTVTEVYEGGDACNVTIQVDPGVGEASEEYAPVITFNSRLMLRADEDPETVEEEAEEEQPAE